MEEPLILKMLNVNGVTPNSQPLL